MEPVQVVLGNTFLSLTKVEGRLTQLPGPKSPGLLRALSKTTTARLPILSLISPTVGEEKSGL